jgi:Fe2+ transport system protein FeoA
MKLENTTIEKKDVRPLNDFRAGTTVRIAGIDAGRGLKNRLASMGLLVNMDICVVRNDGAGQIIVSVKNSKIILGRGMSHKIFVRPC